MQYLATHSVQLDTLTESVANDILQTCFVELALMRKCKTKKSALELLAGNFIRLNVFPIVQLFDNGLLEYASAISTTILNSALSSSLQRKLKEHVAVIFAEKLSLRIFRDFFIYKITSTNKMSCHLLGSYQAVSKNQIRAFAESVVDNIMKDVLQKTKTNQQNRHKWPQNYCETLANKVIKTAFHDILYKVKQNRHEKTVALDPYPQVPRNRAWHSCLKDGNKLTFSKIIKSSFNQSPTTKNNHFRKSSELFSPLSTVIDKNGRKAIDLFAQRLLRSITALDQLDYENITNKGYFQTGDRGGARKWDYLDSPTKRFRINRDFGSDSMNVKTGSHAQGYIASYADDLSRRILRSATFTDFEY